MSISLTILGCHSATPRTFAHPTSQYLEINNRRFLIDCGEGTQVQLRKYKIKFSAIDHIFISHLHGDHYFGLIGLISTLGLLNRKNDLHIYAPTGLKEIITLQLRTSNSWPQFHINFHELESDKSELIFEDNKMEVFTIPLEHRVYTNGFLFKEKIGERKLNIEAIKENPEIEICDYQNLKDGKDFLKMNGKVIDNRKLTFNPNKPLSYAFCSDTVYKPEITSIIKNVDLLYHEATFLKDRQETALTTKHSTAEEAAKIAKKAKVGQLILGHFSSRYDNVELFKQEAETIFDNVILGKEGKIIKIDSKVPDELIIAHQN
ncbi:ribonuclease Z [Aureibaculum sp. 2210JD6-5]|uniref:ribonuclease Z n=1 Tax=Aureibaculum sp. 2210JD6-5 TaxID=3103957 RepID=UPI002AAC4F8D|nr:ribonuclease Z [Aureibaculum sp. 2210JD6-5]MDY7393678.1 ribonuclease Z [Aureibaculum sp. 2210JD6-5]